MNTGKSLFLITLLVCCTCWQALGFVPSLMTGDTIDCLVDFELDQMANGDFVVSMIPDTTWEFPNNVVSTAQVTIKAPKGQLEISEITNLLTNVIFFVIGTDTTPVEAPNFDYISVALGSQGTAGIPFRKGEKVALFSFSNSKTCNSGVITLMNNQTDPFFPPNTKSANVGQQLTAAGFNLADVPIGIIGLGVACSDDGGNGDLEDLGVQIVKQDISCFGERDGIIIAKGNEGSTPYRYLWSTGDTLSTIDNLSAGDYSLTLTDATDSMSISEITIIEPAVLQLTITKTDATGATVADGTATPTLTGGTPPYEFRWNNGSTDSLQTDLLPGTYALAVEDASGCEQLQTVTIDFHDCPVIDVMLDMRAPNCVGDSTGALRIFPMSGVAPFSFLWETGDTTAILDSLPTGSYMVTVTDANGCMMAVSTLLPDAIPIVVDLTADDGAGVGMGSITSTVSGGMMPYTYNWSNGSTETALTDLESGIYELSITDDKGCLQTASAVIAAQACSLGLLDTLGQTIELDTISCFAQGEICLPIPLDSMINYTLFLDGASYMERITGCRFDTFYAYTYFTLPGRGDFGPYVLDEWTINGQNFSGEFLNIVDLVDSMNTWDPVGNWVLDSDILIIQGGLPANQYGEMTIRTPRTTSTTTFDLNTNLTPTGTLVTFASGNHELILVEKRSTCSDTLTVSQPCSDVISRDTLIIIEVVEGRSTILSLNDLFGNNLVISENQCPALMDGNASFNLATTTNELTIEGLMEGTDDICYNIMDENEVNIQFTLRINVSPEPLNCLSFIDLDTFGTTVADCQSFTICAPLNYDSLLTYGITDNGSAFSGVVAPCDNGNGSSLTFTAAKIHQLIFTNSENCLDTVIIAINAPACDEDLVIRDTLEVNDDGRSCIELAGLSSPFQSVQDLCPEKNGEMAMLTIDGMTGCIDYTGIELGVDTACIEICDVFGFCDTITLILIVTSGDIPPPEDFAAINDTVRTTINEAIVFDALANDIFVTLDTMYLVDLPTNGMATFNLDGTISYTPNLDFCDNVNPDIFQYAICADNICDTAVVNIFVPCSDDPDFAAVDDMVQTTINEALVFDPLENDFFVALDTFYLVDMPMNGIASFNLDGTINYAPNLDYCEEDVPDIFQYAICFENICDTATINVLVPCAEGPTFDAVDDSTRTSINAPVVFNALGNDVFTTLDDMYLVNLPDNGIATFNLDGTIRYTPITDYCEEDIPEIFQYAICFENICDTATVTVFVDCTSDRNFTIYNALSPNGDGVNDVFQIDGIEDYPNNRVQIFNRWGSMVYEMPGYKNEWNGNWGRQSALLPDGTYFYLFDTGEGDIISGFLEIKR